MNAYDTHRNALQLQRGLTKGNVHAHTDGDSDVDRHSLSPLFYVMPPSCNLKVVPLGHADGGGS